MNSDCAGANSEDQHRDRHQREHDARSLRMSIASPRPYCARRPATCIGPTSEAISTTSPIENPLAPSSGIRWTPSVPNDERDSRKRDRQRPEIERAQRAPDRGVRADALSGVRVCARMRPASHAPAAANAAARRPAGSTSARPKRRRASRSLDQPLRDRDEDRAREAAGEGEDRDALLIVRRRSRSR